MSQKNYHHGDLKKALIEAGIRIVDQEGMTALSLRKTASLCGVSHAAPYNHFKDKNELLEAMQEYIIDRFTKQLREVITDNSNEDNLPALGCAYLRFFMENPHYYSFIFGQAGVAINFDRLNDDSYPPFDIFKEAAFAEFKKQGKEKDDYLKSILAMWSVVHGFTGMVTMKTIKFSGNWETLLLQILQEKVCP